MNRENFSLGPRSRGARPSVGSARSGALCDTADGRRVGPHPTRRPDDEQVTTSTSRRLTIRVSALLAEAVGPVAAVLGVSRSWITDFRCRQAGDGDLAEVPMVWAGPRRRTSGTRRPTPPRRPLPTRHQTPRNRTQRRPRTPRPRPPRPRASALPARLPPRTPTPAALTPAAPMRRRGSPPPLSPPSRSPRRRASAPLARRPARPTPARVRQPGRSTPARLRQPARPTPARLRQPARPTRARPRPLATAPRPPRKQLRSPPHAPPALRASAPRPRPPRRTTPVTVRQRARSEEHTSELQSRGHLVCRLLLEKKNGKTMIKKALTGIDTARIKEEKQRIIYYEPLNTISMDKEEKKISSIDIPGNQHYFSRIKA